LLLHDLEQQVQDFFALELQVLWDLVASHSSEGVHLPDCLAVGRAGQDWLSGPLLGEVPGDLSVLGDADYDVDVIFLLKSHAAGCGGEDVDI